MTIPPLAQSFDKAGFQAYVENVVAKKLTWRPSMIVLHNTASPTFAQFYKNGSKSISGPQRVKNMWVSYERQGWSGGPHLVITDREILLGNPLWLRGVHSPSWNAVSWGIEMAGNYQVETFPPALDDLATHAIACLFSVLGKMPTNDTFKFHREDPRTTHRTCPGKNVGTKAQWIKDVGARMAALHPGSHVHDLVA